MTEDLPVEFQHIVEQLVRDHPGLEKLTITQRKGGWGVWASHAAISKVLQGKQRSPAALVSYIQKWLEQATLVPIFELHPESSEIDPSEWATSMMESHNDLSELSATERDGVVTIEAFHEHTGYSIQRCYMYTSWNLAAGDLVKWVQSLSRLNTTAAPRLSRSSHRPSSYDGTRRWAKAGHAGPGRP